jgi:formylmethanofuran dehydrogenase subunit E
MADYSRCPFEGELYEARTVGEALDVLAAIVEGPCLVACDRCDFAVPAGELQARPRGIGRPVCGECFEAIEDEAAEDESPHERRRALGVVGFSGF